MKHFLFFAFMFSVAFAHAQETFTRADTLKGTITKERAWWDVLHYDLHVSFNEKDSSIFGSNKILYKVLDKNSTIQIDLMQPMQIDSVFQNSKRCEWKRDGNTVFISLPEQTVNEQNEVLIYFHGKPHAAKLPPWDGGIIWKKDKNNNAWISVACQGIGAQVWFPNKDHQYDEPDSVSIHITANQELTSVSNGNLISIKEKANETKTYHWKTVNPINNYNIIPYIGRYENFSDTLHGKGGVLEINYWVLQEHLEKAKAWFKDVKPMLRCYEDWFGKYPFYEDGYKIVEAPHLGMEHQSAIAYGNKFQNGYVGQDWSNTGWGLKWDFIVVHESGHEWFGNNITAQDAADNWIHESFTCYAENLYTEYLFGKKAGAEYVIGTRSEIKNDKPMIGVYNVNQNGSGDVYWKGANMLHTLRQIVNNDSLWKEMFRGLNRTFWHQTVITQQIENYMSSFLKLNLTPFFNQYLRTAQVPTFEYKIKKNKVLYRWVNCVKDFDMPVKIFVNVNEKELWLNPKTKRQKISVKAKTFAVDKNFYVRVKKR
ncbi:MAG: M1 family metallopeptidase [Bacteroidetes bacterium]|nr:M1 family metallopeptidase [Bacteroidota bacterium]